MAAADVVDLLGRRDLLWTRVGAAYVLAAGDDGWVGIEQLAPDRWAVLRQASYKGPLVMIEQVPDFNWAMGRAEDLARPALGSQLRDRDAHWRSHPMSAAQRAFFERWRLPLEPTWTKGEAADRQTATLARWSWAKGQRRTMRAA